MVLFCFFHAVVSCFRVISCASEPYLVLKMITIISRNVCGVWVEIKFQTRVTGFKDENIYDGTTLLLLFFLKLLKKKNNPNLTRPPNFFYLFDDILGDKR